MPRKPIDDADLRQRLGERLRALRKAAGLTQEELGARAGMHKSDVSRLERAERAPSLETMAALSAALGISMAVLLDLSEDDELLALNVMLTAQPPETIRLIRGIAQLVINADSGKRRKK